MTREELFQETLALIYAYKKDEISSLTCAEAIEDMVNRYAYAIGTEAIGKMEPDHCEDSFGFLHYDAAKVAKNACRATFLANIKAKTNQ